MENKRFIEILRKCYENDFANEGPRSYSGRAMYGRRCVGITTDIPCGMVAAAMLVAEDDQERETLAEIFRQTRQDNMGLSTIIYWPSVRLAENEQVDEDDEDEEDGE